MRRIIKAYETRETLEYCNCKTEDYDDSLKELDELERLAEIGRAAEKAFEKQTVLLIHYRLWDGSYEGEYEFEEIEELLEWHRKQEAK